jgi:hypothetical protein
VRGVVSIIVALFTAEQLICTGWMDEKSERPDDLTARALNRSN